MKTFEEAIRAAGRKLTEMRDVAIVQQIRHLLDSGTPPDQIEVVFKEGDSPLSYSMWVKRRGGSEVEKAAAMALLKSKKSGFSFADRKRYAAWVGAIKEASND
jgi:hypothetical protein